ncbi:MAG: methyltransferase domain-containing protein [Planctomycetota bacterium]
MPTLPASLQAIVDALTGATDVTPHHVKKIVEEANVQPEDLAPWADFDHPSADSYGRVMAYDGGSFEVMVMSWRPGDYSAMHDHGYTMWGAVQVFGAAEHAVCAQDIDKLVTLSRVRLSPGRVMAVTHDLVHQMGNPTDEQFLTLHVYGHNDRQGGITGDARVFDFGRQEVQTTDGGVFYSLPGDSVKTRTPSPEPDYYTRLFDMVQNARRRQRARLDTQEVVDQMTDPGHWQAFKDDLESRLDESVHVTDSRYWTLLTRLLREASLLQGELIDGVQGPTPDTWRTYAALYDHVIGTTNSYMTFYMRKVFEAYGVDAANVSMIDVGCGTGWFEEQLTSQLGVDRERLLGVDPSPAMVQVAGGRTRVRQAGLLDMDTEFGQFDVTFCNSYQYLPHEDLDEAVGRMAAITKPGGLCVSEFITPDHIRWYPNVVFSESDQVISLRQPTLTERGGYTYQNSEIINVSRLDGMRVTHEGVHRRFMVSPKRLREVFDKHFGDRVTAYDGKSFKVVSPESETCPSTRYVLVANK